jgi:hypothetical protein
LGDFEPKGDVEGMDNGLDLLNKKRGKPTKGNPRYFYEIGVQPKKVKSGVRSAFVKLLTNPSMLITKSRSLKGSVRFWKVTENSLGVSSPVTSPIPKIEPIQSTLVGLHITFVTLVEVNTKLLFGVIPD